MTPSLERELLFDQVLRNLHRVQGGSLADLIRYGPEAESLVVGQVLADTTHVDRVFAAEAERHGILLLGGIVDHHHTLTSLERLTRLLNREGTFGLHPGHFRVSPHHRHTDTGCT